MLLYKLMCIVVAGPNPGFHIHCSPEGDFAFVFSK